MVSIVVPVYKSEQTLKRCVNSLLAQTYEDIEILLVVDAPPDGSGILCDELAKTDSRIRVLNQKNEGVSVSRNHGIAHAKGEYVRFVDSDDYVLPDSIEILVKAMEAGKADVVIAGFHHQYFGRRIWKVPHGAGTYSMEEAEAYLYELYLAGYLNMPWNKLYKRELIVNEFPREFNLGEDLLFNLAYLNGCKTFTVVEESVCEYIQDDRGTTLSTKRRADKLSLTIRLYERTREAFHKIFPDSEENPVLTTKLVTEFLDDLEGLAFEKQMSVKEKKDMIRVYEQQLADIQAGDRSRKPDLKLLDYKIIYYFLNKKMTNVTYSMIYLRGVVVKLLHKR